MKDIHPALPLLALSATSGASLIPIGEHADIRCHWSAGSWSTALHIESDENPYDPATVFLVLSDRPYNPLQPAQSGSRVIRPAQDDFDFTGVQSGDPLWVAVQGIPGNGEAWPGFDSQQSAGTFGSYIPPDSRVSQVTPRPWIRISLLSYQPPPGGGDFSMWTTTSGNPPTVWMSTHDDEVENSYYFIAGSHTHMNWGFTRQGIHRVTFRASAFAGPGATNPTGFSAPMPLTFAVGTFARWQAENFGLSQLDDEQISGPQADPDGDGLVNLIEYAFGTPPLNGSSTPVANGLGLPVFTLSEENGIIYQTLTHPRRKAGDRLHPEIHQPLFADSPAGPWSDDGVETIISEFPPAQAALNAEWELVTSRRPVPSGASSGFGRVAVTAGDRW